MKKIILFGGVLWGTWLLADVYYGEKNTMMYFQPIIEILFLWIMSCIVQKLKNQWQLIGKTILFFTLMIYFVQCLYYSQVGEFISVLALENADQIYLLVQPIYICILLLIIFTSTFLCKKSNSIVMPSRKVKILMGGAVLLLPIIYIQNTSVSLKNKNIENIIQNVHQGGDPCSVILQEYV